MLSDTTDAYTEEKLEIIRKTLPPLTTCTAETGPLNLDFPAYTWTKLHGFAVQSHETPVEMEDVNLKDAYDMAGIYPTMNDKHPFSSLWSFHINHAGETWCVAGRFATIPLKASKLNLEQISLDASASYHVFDFWNEKYLGKVTGEVAVKELGLGECQILGFRKVKEVSEVTKANGKTKKEKVINFKLDINKYFFNSTELINEKIISALNTKAFDSDFRIDFEAKNVRFAERGIEGKLVEIIDYGVEKYAKYDVNGHSLNVLVEDYTPETAYFDLDLDSVGITETKIDMKLL